MKQKFASDSIKTGPGLALIVHPEIRSVQNISRRSTDAMVNEIEGLVRAIQIEPIDTRVLSVSRIQPGAFFGKGQRDEVADIADAVDPEIIVVNHALSPVQQRNLENAWNAKVIDRTGLILEIFGARAQTKEGRLQVELAALEYQKSRLVRSWTHLERQRGGAGFMGGPGERQIEIDRRLISHRMIKLKKELDTVRRTRDLGRQSRAKVPFPVVALVGYTNAGKSTLFNALTDADIMAEDLLFATLDPTLRKIKLPSGRAVILSDTVGFIADLPTHLIAAFRATLEETLHGDVLLHMIDVSHDDYRAQRADVIDILNDLGIEYDDDPRILEVYNKIDAVNIDELTDLRRGAKFHGQRVFISAQDQTGLDVLLQDVDGILNATHIKTTFAIPHMDGKAIAWLYDHAEVLERKELDCDVEISLLVDPAICKQFTIRFGYEAT